MKMDGNTILITGGGSGIGRGLAEAFHRLGNTVIIAGRRQETLDEVTAANPGIVSVVLDVDDPDSIRAVMAEIGREYPALNVLINNAGIYRNESVDALPDMLTAAEAQIVTDLMGPVRLTVAFLSHLHTQPTSMQSAAILNVTSGLAFVPLGAAPTYSAVKAALHVYSQALRVQLRESSIQVIELIPTQTATELSPGQSQDPTVKPLAAYISETMHLLQAQPDATEIVIDDVKYLRDATRGNHFDEAFALLNP